MRKLELDYDQRKTIKTWSIVTLCVVAFILLIVGYCNTSTRDIEMLKEKAPIYAEASGFVIEGYIGYGYNPIYGGNIYYLAHRKENPTILYKLNIVEWKGDLQMFVPKVINHNMVLKE